MSGKQYRCSNECRYFASKSGKRQSKTPHIGIDEWAWQRGHTYGTLIVNLDSHRSLALLPGREKRALTTWFRKYPEIKVVSRDRGGIYAFAAREGAPQARQVADRWYLLKNIGDALERMMHRYIRLIREVSNELSPKIAVHPVIWEVSSTPSNAIRLKQQKREARYKRWIIFLQYRVNHRNLSSLMHGKVG